MEGEGEGGVSGHKLSMCLILCLCVGGSGGEGVYVFNLCVYVCVLRVEGRK